MRSFEMDCSALSQKCDQINQIDPELNDISWNLLLPKHPSRWRTDSFPADRVGLTCRNWVCGVFNSQIISVCPIWRHRKSALITHSTRRRYLGARLLLGAPTSSSPFFFFFFNCAISFSITAGLQLAQAQPLWCKAGNPPLAINYVCVKWRIHMSGVNCHASAHAAGHSGLKCLFVC